MRIREWDVSHCWVPDGAVVPRWWQAPGLDDFPALGDEKRMGAEAVKHLAAGAHPAAVARELGRRWPLYRRLMPELVRSILDQARGVAAQPHREDDDETE